MKLSQQLAALQASKTNAFVYKRSATEILSLVDAANSPSSPFNGKLFGIKANFAVKGWPSDACSRVLDTYKSPFNATVVDQIQANGGVLVGLTNMDEFGMGSTGATSVHGKTINPWGPNMSPGGSSSGSAAAVAEGLVYCAIGSDTGGSVRLPAAHCGVVGFKPSRGAVSRFGLIAYANSLDCVGILCKRVQEVSNVFHSIRGADDRDMTCRTKVVDDDDGDNAVTVGLCEDFAFPEMSPSVLEYWKRAALHLAEAGLPVNDQCKLPTLTEALPAYYVIALAEASSNLARYDGVRYGYRTKQQALELREEYAATRTEAFGEEVQRRLLMGSLALTRRNKGDDDTCFYSMATRVRQRLEDDFEQCFEQCDVLLLPTAPWPGGMKTATNSVVDAFLEDTLTVPASLCGLPAISIPCGLCAQTGAPIGMQIIGKMGQDRKVLQVAAQLEAAFQFSSSPPTEFP